MQCKTFKLSQNLNVSFTVSFTLKLTSNYYFDAVQTLFPLGNANLLLDKYVKSATLAVLERV